MPLPAAVFGQAGTRVVAQAIGMSPFVTGLVAAAVNQCTNTVAATEPVTNPAILIITPCVGVGYLLEHVGVPLAHNAAGDSVVRLDRKSTPLNSSHEKNSYAVFC